MQWGCGLISFPFLSVVSLTVQISKAWATPRLASLKGLILIFQQASPFTYVPFISESPPLQKKKEKKKRGLYNQRQALGSFLRFRYVRVTWDICDAWPASCTARDQRLSALPFTLFALVQDLHAMAVRKVALPVDESAHSEQACDCKY